MVNGVNVDVSDLWMNLVSVSENSARRYLLYILLQNEYLSVYSLL